MLTPGRPFVVNILAQGKDKGVMKQLLKPFKPGEDRFQGLETEVWPCCWHVRELCWACAAIAAACAAMPTRGCKQASACDHRAGLCKTEPMLTVAVVYCK